VGSTGRLCKEECLETALKGIGGGESLVSRSIDPVHGTCPPRG